MQHDSTITGPHPSGDPEHGLDAAVVDELCGYLTSTPPRSFFLYAGAGSGKTRTLIEILRRLTGLHGDYEPGPKFAQGLRVYGQTIRVITYTNNAVDIIRGRLGNNPLVSVSTIHSFAWELIRGFNEDIRSQIQTDLEEQLKKTEHEALLKRRGASEKARTKIESLRKQLTELAATPRFTYSPDQNTYGPGALQHHQVLRVAAALLMKPTLAQLLCDRHPAILIDESQDTMKTMLDSLLRVSEEFRGRIVLGLIGDHRQRIYNDGLHDLPAKIPAHWARPALRMNHRSAKRIVRLANKIWASSPTGRTQPFIGEEQYARSDRPEGFVRLFLGAARLPTDIKTAHERACAEEMATVTGDPAWRDHESGYRTLVLEHKLAARREGFYDLVIALEGFDKDSTWLLGETLDARDAGPNVLRVFTDPVAALYNARQGGALDGFAAMKVLQRTGQLNRLGLLSSDEQQRLLRRLSIAVQAVTSVFDAGDPTLSKILETVVEHDLFELPPDLRNFQEDVQCSGGKEGAPTESDKRRENLRKVLERPWSEFLAYKKYLAGLSRYGTHQGVKGSEFENVQVILDDTEARGFLFSYDKLLGGTALSKADLENARANKETTIDRTLRLLYVTCSRPKNGLAIVYWSKDPRSALTEILKLGWFELCEIRQLEPAD